ncbi:RING finger protein 4 [Girardinichthys multiradiatus]|uniref:RING finger protein 4 n=1 Tax=Girardinichthys multiradiatus TaxID=208333 RepID=UPI001FAC6989|nr:RING finger protein 4 [Girardinichthys multiradiatus]XP_047210591.1 RING finger protein 4 [Girardinichthys multiradiatus]
MSSSAQRKRRPTGNSLVSRTKTRRTANSRPLSRRTANASNPAPPTEPIDVSTEDGVEEVVDLTCEGSEAAVVDLTTNNDSVLLVDEGPLNDIVSSSYVLSSDEEGDMSTGIDAAITSSVQTSRFTPGLINCPICLDLYSEIVDSGRLVVSTKCGHVFCSQCLRDAVTSSHTCPTCRKRLTPRQYHPLYI